MNARFAKKQETFLCHGFNCFCIDLLRLLFFLVVMGLRVGARNDEPFLGLQINNICNDNAFLVMAVTCCEFEIYKKQLKKKGKSI